MKTLFFYLLWTVILSVGAVNAQNENLLDYFKHLPGDMESEQPSIRSYQMVTDYYNFDLKRNFLGKKRVTGIITYGLDGDSVQWRDVYNYDSRTLDTEFSHAQRRDFMQDFKYLPDDKVLTPKFFSDRLPEADPSIMNIIWDALCFDVLAYNCWDSLKLNQEFRAKNMNSELEIANIGTFENRDIRITWIGITEMNNEICAILKYLAMNNPLEMKLENMTMSGRSHYWGEIYVSLSNKQIEYANLTEDVLTDMELKGLTDHIFGYTIRTIELSKINN